jgi:hypothetical protein
MPLPLGLRMFPYTHYKKSFVKSIDNLKEEYKMIKNNKTAKTTKGKKMKDKKTLKNNLKK